jgi:hypothetical protein
VPEVSSITPSTIGPTNADRVEFEILFSEDMVNFNDAADLLIDHVGTAHSGIEVSGYGSRFSVIVDGISGSGSFTLQVNLESDIQNMAGLALEAGVVSPAVVIDNIGPTLAIGPPSTGNTTDGPVTYTVTFDGADAIMLTGSDVILERTGSANADIAVSGTGKTSRTITLYHVVGSGTLGISLASGTAADLAGNTTAASGPSETFTVQLGNLIHIDSFEPR